MDRRIPLLLNGGEQKADAALREALSAHGLVLDRKVRLASVLQIDGSGISSEDFSYALRAELDFVVGKGPNRSPEFAVEFDGYQHLSNPTTIARDRKKDRVCEKLGLPLLRIGVEALNRRRKRTILAWLIDVFYLAKRFYEMQDEGVIAPDEPFMYFSIFDTTPDGHLGPSFALDQEARLAMFEMARLGEAPGHVPEQITMDAYRPDTRLELIESFALFELNQERFIAGRARVRNFGHFGGISASELAKDLALADAGERLARYRQGRYQPFGPGDLKRLRGKTKGWRREGSSCSDLPFPAFNIG
jgi:uncharacterized protein DUF2726